MQNTDYLLQFETAEKISRGMSGDEKYRVEKNGADFLLRVSDAETYPGKKREYEYLEHLNRAGLPVPQCISFEKDERNGEVYTLLSWMEGEEAEKLLPQMLPAEQYNCGVKAGRILRGIHEASPETAAEETWYDRYFAVIEPRLEAFRKEGIPFEGYEKILRFIEDNKHLLHTRPMCRHHGDYHTGNLIVNGAELCVIDWHTVDFDNIGDPWYEFNRIGTECPVFARGQIDGYFAVNVPQEFWRLFALYFSASAITSIVWAKHWAKDQLGYILELNRSVLQMFDGMENPIPKWYRQ